MRALRRPSPKTVCVAGAYRPHPRQPAAAARSARIEARSGRKAAAPAASPSSARRRVGVVVGFLRFRGRSLLRELVRLPARRARGVVRVLAGRRRGGLALLLLLVLAHQFACNRYARRQTD